MKKSNKSKKAGKPTVTELPSTNVEMESFLDKHREKVLESVTSSIEYAAINSLAGIEVFRFNKSNYIAFIARKDFKENLTHIFKMSIESENYELCDKIIKIRKVLETPMFFKDLKRTTVIQNGK